MPTLLDLVLYISASNLVLIEATVLDLNTNIVYEHGSECRAPTLLAGTVATLCSYLGRVRAVFTILQSRSRGMFQLPTNQSSVL